MSLLCLQRYKKIRYSIKSSGFFCSKDVFLTLQAFYCHALVGFYVLNNLLVVVVGAASHKVKLQKRLASPASQLQVYCLQQVEHLQALFTELTVCRTAALPVRHHIKVHKRLGTYILSQ